MVDNSGERSGQVNNLTPSVSRKVSEIYATLDAEPREITAMIVVPTAHNVADVVPLSVRMLVIPETSQVPEVMFCFILKSLLDNISNFWGLCGHGP
ncbi:hypothetical protein NPIL_602481 [Nephila pilipes]|uniref:Uncharacterized protein n=1 Tax=Nephila pilipes TaxID=299642 RepID=A0A8X6MTU7_NEPPI|nr:hypothetical protein NPIL_602481 [Nephila pilipes]